MTSQFGTKYERPLNLPQKDVFLNGTNKSLVWTSPPHSVPTYPTWTELRAVRYNPRLTRRNTSEFQAEENWTEYHRQRHTPSDSIMERQGTDLMTLGGGSCICSSFPNDGNTGYYGHSIGTIPTGVPALKLDGYTRHISGMPPRDIFLNRWPKADSWMPPARAPRGQYYGYYHEAIEAERFMRDRIRSTHERITPFDIPRVTSLNNKQVHRDVDCDLGGGLS